MRHTNAMKKFLRSTVFLAFAGVVSKLLGALHKLPLMGLLGAEGTGLYHLVFPVYTAVLALTSGGITQAVSRSAAIEGGRAPHALRAGLAVTLITGAIGSAFIALTGGYISALQGNTDAAPAYLALAPSAVLSGIIATLRGWWQGRRNMFPTAASNLIEQGVKLFSGLGLAVVLMPYGVPYAAAGAIGGITLSEAVASAALLTGLLPLRRSAASVAAHMKKERFSSGDAATGKTPAAHAENSASDVQVTDTGLGQRQVIRTALVICRDAFPIALASLIIPLSQFIDSIMIVNILGSMGSGVEQATSLYGVVTAPVSAISGFPPVITTACAAALMPRLSGVEWDESKASAAGFALNMAFLTGLAGAAISSVFSVEIINLLYPAGLNAEESGSAALALVFSAPGTFSVCMMQIVTTVLQARGKSSLPALMLLLSCAVKAGLTAIFIPIFGAAGSAAATSVSYIAALAADFALARKYLKGRMDMKLALKSLLAVAAGGIAGGTATLLPVENALAVCIVCGIIFVLTMLLVLVFFNAFSVNERISAVADKIKIISVSLFKKSKKY